MLAGLIAFGLEIGVCVFVMKVVGEPEMSLCGWDTTLRILIFGLQNANSLQELLISVFVNLEQAIKFACLFFIELQAFKKKLKKEIKHKSEAKQIA